MPTTGRGIVYPSPPDPVDIPADMQQMAESVDDAIGVVESSAGYVAQDLRLTSPATTAQLVIPPSTRAVRVIGAGRSDDDATHLTVGMRVNNVSDPALYRGGLLVHDQSGVATTFGVSGTSMPVGYVGRYGFSFTLDLLFFVNYSAQGVMQFWSMQSPPHTDWKAGHGGVQFISGSPSTIQFLCGAAGFFTGTRFTMTAFPAID